MSSLLWPGDDRAGDLMSDRTLLRAMVRVEAAWLAALVDLKVAEPAAADGIDQLASVVTDDDLAGLADAAEAGGNPVIALVSLLRTRLEPGSPATAAWLHRGLTSQDVLDTALQLGLRDVADRVDRELTGQIGALAGLATQHRATVMAGRTLTQYAVPVTFGLKAATWLHGVLDAAEDLRRARAGLAGQLGGAAGTLAAGTVLAQQAGNQGGADGPQIALDLAAQVCAGLGLVARPPWHTARAPVTRFGDALVTCTDAWGRVAGDVLTLTRPEIGELAEPAAPGRGRSSALPDKENPILSVLIRRAALAAPPLAGQLHLAAALAHDERPDGAWHTEWATLQTLARRAVVAAAETGELLAGLQVHGQRMRTNAEAAADALLAEGRSLGASPERPDDYLGANELLVEAALGRARSWLGAPR